MNPSAAWAKRLLTGPYAKAGFKGMDDPEDCEKFLNDIIDTGKVDCEFLYSFRNNYATWCEKTGELRDRMPIELINKLNAWLNPVS